MSFQVLEFVTTPNPNAIKCMLDGVISARTESFRRDQNGEDENGAGPTANTPKQTDPLAQALLEIPGVTGVMFCSDFVTISKEPDAKWRAIQTRAKSVLAKVERTPE